MAFIDARVRERGLEGRVEIRLQDYRDVDSGPYDAVASLAGRGALQPAPPPGGER